MKKTLSTLVAVAVLSLGSAFADEPKKAEPAKPATTAVAAAPATAAAAAAPATTAAKPATTKKHTTHKTKKAQKAAKASTESAAAATESAKSSTAAAKSATESAKSATESAIGHRGHQAVHRPGCRQAGHGAQAVRQKDISNFTTPRRKPGRFVCVESSVEPPAVVEPEPLLGSAADETLHLESSGGP